MNYVGISCGFHDAAMSIIDDSGNILFSGHSERYSKIKHDKNLCKELILDAKSYSVDHEIHYYENSYKKYFRKFYSGESFPLRSVFPSYHIGKDNLKLLGNNAIHVHDHHLSHAASGFQTSPFDKATVVIIDAIGELDTVSIWSAEYVNGIATYKKVWSLQYPYSIGLFYSAMTKRVNLKPLDEEYILMGMSAYGDTSAYTELFNEVINNEFEFKLNLHKGVPQSILSKFNDFQIARATQLITEWLISMIMIKAKSLNISDNLVYGGGVALNCTANRLLGTYFKNIWILPNPGDAGSSLGAAALGYKKKLNWVDSYLGFNIGGEYPVDSLVKELLTNNITAVANGRAEFGPRALGNRSLLANPRGSDIKSLVNGIKRRQQFRPFAPVILEEYVHDYFELPNNWSNSRYMQVVAKCKYPDKYPAITHIDNTSRVQTVPKVNSGIRLLLEKWYEKTGCPMLLNTSLNIRNESMVNDINDAKRFEVLYGLQVFT